MPLEGILYDLDQSPSGLYYFIGHDPARPGMLLYQAGPDRRFRRAWLLQSYPNIQEVAALQNGCLIASGQHEEGPNVSLTRIDSAGTVLWSRWYRLADSANTSTGIRRLSVNAQGEALLAIERPTLDRLFKVDTNGIVLWSRQLRHSEYQQGITDARFCPDGTLLVAGQADGQAFITKLDSHGNSVWNYRPDGFIGEVIKIFPFEDKAILILQRGWKQYLVQITEQGLVNWANTWPYLEGSFSDLARSSFGSIVLTGGFYNRTLGRSEIRLLEFDINGLMRNAKIFGTDSTLGTFGGTRVAKLNRMGEILMVGAVSKTSNTYNPYWSIYNPANCDMQEWDLVSTDTTFQLTGGQNPLASSQIASDTFTFPIAAVGGCPFATCDGQINPGPFLGQDHNHCQQSFLDTLSAANFSGRYRWSTGDTSAIITISQPGRYTVEITSTCGAFSDTVQVSAIPKPIVDAGPPLNLCEGDTSYFRSTQVEESEYVWKPERNLLFTPSGVPKIVAMFTGTDYQLSQKIIYTLTATNFLSSCQNSDTTSVTIHSRYELKPDGLPYCSAPALIPNLITPNGDDQNDAFKVNILANYQQTTLTIYNRYGEQVFHQSPYANTWDGDNLPPGHILLPPPSAGRRVGRKRLGGAGEVISDRL